jgi:hypothetical protein
VLRPPSARSLPERPSRGPAVVDGQNVGTAERIHDERTSEHDDRREEERVRPLQHPPPRVEHRAPHPDERQAGDGQERRIGQLPQHSRDHGDAERDLECAEHRHEGRGAEETEVERLGDADAMRGVGELVGPPHHHEQAERRAEGEQRERLGGRHREGS